MSLFNSEQTKLYACKEELKNKTEGELQEIANRTTKTAFMFSSGKKKLYQVAAFQILRERINS